MAKVKFPWSALGMGTVVAIGSSVTFTILAILAMSLVESATWDGRAYRNLVITPDGEPVFLTGTLLQPVVTSLTGEPRDVARNELTNVPYLYGLEWMRGSPFAPSWDTRITSCNDGRPTPAYWYLIHDGGVPGRAYGVGYDAATKRIAGYFGRQGFVAAPPDRQDWFVVPGTTGLTGRVSYTSDREPINSLTHAIYLLADDRLWVIDCYRREVHSALETREPVSLGSALKVDAQRAQAIPSTEPSLTNIPLPPAPLSQRYAVRGAESISLVGGDGTVQSTIAIPADMRHLPLAAVVLPNGGSVLVGYPNSSDVPNQIAVWMNASGEEERRVTFPTISLMANERAATNLMMLGAVPSFAGQVMLTVVAGLAIDNPAKEPLGAMDAVVDFAKLAWPAVATSFAIGLVAAIFAYRRQQRFALPHAWTWALFVLLLGLPGWIAYRWHRDWPPLGGCPACGQTCVQDRNCCTECGAKLPPPRPLGIEVFA